MLIFRHSDSYVLSFRSYATQHSKHTLLGLFLHGPLQRHRLLISQTTVLLLPTTRNRYTFPQPRLTGVGEAAFSSIVKHPN